MIRSQKKAMQALAPLDQVGWLGSESAEFRDWIASNGHWQRYAAGQVVYMAGDEPDGLYGLRYGTLEISVPLKGAELALAHWAEPGVWIGESAFLAGEKRGINVTSVSETMLFHVPASAIRRRLADHPQSWPSFFRQSHLNALTAVRMLAEALALTPRARFARLLLRLAGGGDTVSGSQAELGAAVGLRVATAKRMVASLVALGAIRSGYGRITILDRSVLETYADEEPDADVAVRGPSRADPSQSLSAGTRP